MKEPQLPAYCRHLNIFYSPLQSQTQPSPLSPTSLMSQQPLQPSHESSLVIPMQMNPKDKCTTIELSRQYMRIIYQGSGKTDSDAASVRSKDPIPPQMGIFYYEVSIVSKGRDGYIGIGFCAPNVSLQRLPGWEPDSWGYHGDDGNCFNCSGTGKKYGPTFSTGDVVGCGINFAERSAFFTKNGLFLGTAFHNLNVSRLPIFPCVGLRTPGEVVEVNFGKTPFSFDIVSFIHEQRDMLDTRITHDIPDQPAHVIARLIIKYMLFHGHLQAAESFARSLGHNAIDEVDMMRYRLKIQLRQMIDSSAYDDLLSAVQQQFTSASDLLIFHIKCQKFVDLVRGAFLAPATSENRNIMQLDNASAAADPVEEYERIKAALDYGQRLQDEYRADERQVVQNKLIDIFSLLAYPNPLETPSIKHLFSDDSKTRLFDMLNMELFEEDNLLAKSIKQLQAVSRELQSGGDGSVALMSSIQNFF